MSKLPTKSLELMLAGWRESNNSGFVVSFFVQPEDEDYFRHATARKGKLAGQRYQAVFVQLTDDEKPDQESLPPPKPKTPEQWYVELSQKFKEAGLNPSDFLRPLPVPRPTVELPTKEVVDRAADAVAAAQGTKPAARKSHFPDGLCGLAVRWCEDDHFQLWLEETFPGEWLRFDRPQTAERAAAVVKSVCGVSSRKELDTSKGEGPFRDKIMGPYKARREEDGVDGEHF